MGKIFAWLLGVALFNFALFTVCFFWTELNKIVFTRTGMVLVLTLSALLCIPLAVIHYLEQRKKEGYRKMRMRQKIEAAAEQKEIGIDF